MPEQMIEKIKKSLLPQWKVSFLSALIIGVVAHLYKITNWLPNWDSLVFRYDSQNMLSLGRWFLPVVTSSSSFYDLPWLTGLMAIIFHALGAVCICKIFDVKKNITAVLISGVVATLPTVTSVMLYNYVADGYAVAFLLSCIAAMLLLADKPRYIFASVLIALSAGIYQAYVTVTITLILLSLIFEALYKNTDLKKLLLKGVRLLLSGAFGMVLYYLVMTALLKITGTELLDYQGFNSATTFGGLDIAGSLFTVKETILNYFFDFSSGLNVFGIINCIVILLIAVFYITDLVRAKLSVGRIIVLFLLAALLPFGATALAFINSTIDYHNLMRMGFVAFYLLLILQYEKCDFKNVKLSSAKAWSILLVVTILIFNQIVIANVSYHKLTMAYEKSYGTLIRIADRIENTEGSGECESILVLGALSGSEAYSVNLPPDITGTTDSYILRADDEVVGQSVFCSAINDYCSKNYRFLAGEEKAQLLQKIDADSMNNWPASNSISVVDGVIVIKLGD